VAPWVGVGSWELTRVLGDRKYQFMEQNLQRRVAGLKGKLPDIQKTLDTVRFLALRKVGCDPDREGERLLIWGRTRRSR
jgi:hypothetical protein